MIKWLRSKEIEKLQEQLQRSHDLNNRFVTNNQRLQKHIDFLERRVKKLTNQVKYLNKEKSNDN